MRAPFNTLCTIYAGPGTATPGAPRATDVPCRLVPDPMFIDVDAPLSLSLHYLTLTGAVPLGPTITDLGGGEYKLEYAKSDRIEVNSHPDDVWIVVRTEFCIGDPPAPYYRASLARDEGGGGSDPVPGTDCASAGAIAIGQMVELLLSSAYPTEYWYKITTPGAGTYSLVVSDIAPSDRAGVNVYRDNNCPVEDQAAGRRSVGCTEFALPGLSGGNSLYIQVSTNVFGVGSTVIFQINAGPCPLT